MKNNATYVLFPLVFLVGMWVSTGTLTPYAYTLDEPLVLEQCQYLANLDHSSFLAHFNFLEGQPKENWQESNALRRMLFPFLAYPLVSQLGVGPGSFFTAVILSLICFYFFVGFIKKKYGEHSAVVASAVLATYPGTMYWVGLPYCYAAIVPISLLSFLALNVIDETDSLFLRALLFLCMGILFLGYELLPFFGVAGLWLIVRKKNIGFLVLFGLLMVLPTLLMLVFLESKGVKSNNTNTATYFHIIQAYLHPQNLRRWAGLVARFPLYLTEAYFFSNFLFLPLAFLILAFLMKIRGVFSFTKVEKAILLVGFLLYAFNNLAPPYEGWQMRGGWIPRIYQPLFVVFISFIARLAKDIDSKRIFRQVYIGCVVALVSFNSWVVFGPYLGTEWNLVLYERFYGHGKPGASAKNLEKYGRRPIGVCN